MSTVTPMNAAGISNPEVNIGSIFQSTKNITRAAFFKAQQYQVLQEKSNRVKGYAQEVEAILRGQIPVLQAELENTAPADYFSSIHEIDAALLETGNDADTIAELKTERGHVTKELSEALREANDKVGLAATELGGKIAELAKVVLLERAEEPLALEQKRNDEGLAKIVDKEERIEEYRAERKKIVDAQDIIREKNLADIFKDYLPDVSDLSSEDLAAPEVVAIKQAMELTRKIVGNVSDGLKYTALADARNKLDGDIERLNQDIAVITGDLEREQAIIGDLGTVIKIDAERKIIAAEAGKIQRSWEDFNRAVSALSGQDATLVNIEDVLGKQMNFLDNLADQIGKVVLV